MGKPSTNPLFVRSLAKGLSILQAFSSQRPALTLTDLAAATGLPLAAAQRYAHTLLALGYLSRDERKEFSLGPQALSLARAGRDGSGLRKLAEPLLHAFSVETGCSVNLSVLQGLEAVVLYRHEVARFFKFDLREGSRLPAHCTSLGKVLLAALPERELARRLGGVRLERITPHTITGKERLRRELRAVRKAGYAQCDGEAALTLFSQAVPIIDRAGAVVAAVNVSLPRVENNDEQKRKSLSALIRVGSELCSRLGYQGPYPCIPRPAPRRPERISV